MHSAAKRIHVLGIVLTSLLNMGLCDSDEPTYTLRVRDADGRPIQKFDYTWNGGRQIQVQPLFNGKFQEVRSISDSSGVARVVHYNDVTLFVGAPGYVTKPTIVPAEKPSEVVVTLDRAAKVSGKIVDSSGEPVVGAHVWLGSVPRYGHHGLPKHIMESDWLGRIESDRIPKGETSFGIAHPDFVPAVHQRLVELDRVNNLSFVMIGAATLQGLILFGVEPPEYADVVVYTGDLDESTVPDSKMAKCRGGAFVVKGIVPGTNQVDFRASQPRPGFDDRLWTLTNKITFAENDNRKVETRIPTGTSSIAGRLHLAGTPLTRGKSVYVTLKEVNAERSLKIGMRPNDEGDYAFDSVPSGRWTMTARAWDEQSKKLYQFEKEVFTAVDESLRMDFDLPEVALESR